MSIWRTWLRYPQNLWIRKAVFQVHLWTGIAAGLYVVLISVSGSAVVYRRELVQALSPKPVLVARTGERMNLAELKQAAQTAYPDYEVIEVFERENPGQAVEVSLRRGGSRLERLFNPYTGADLGNRLRVGFRLTLWLVDLHDNLLLGRTGRFLNGVGAILVTVLTLAGLFVWWPGIRNWRAGLIGAWTGSAKRVNWSLHSVLGFWCFLFILMWAISGIYFSFPEPFNAAVEFLEPQDPSSRTVRVGEDVLTWLARLHIGRFRGWLQVLWTIIGLVPVALFITGVIMWWRRVLRPAPRNRKRLAKRRLRATAVRLGPATESPADR